MVLCTANSPFADHQAIASKKIEGDAWPGQTDEINLAWTTHWPSTGYLPCGIANTFEEVDVVQSVFDWGFSSICSPVSVSTPEKERTVVLYPNPASEYFEIRMPKNFGECQVIVFSIAGQQVASAQHVSPNDARVSVMGLPTGIYVVKISTDVSVFSQRIVVK